MRETIPTAAYRQSLSLIVVSALTVLSAIAGAQGAGPNSIKPNVPSFANARSAKQGKDSGSNVVLAVASEQATADAIAAESLDDLFDMANNDHFHHGEYNHTINLNQVVMEGNPQKLETYCNNSYLLWSTDRKDQGLLVLKKGLAANSKTYYMYDEIGNYYRLELKDYSGALPYFEQATKFDCPAVTWHGLALCYEKGGQWDKAVKAWAAACRDPNDKQAIVRLKRAQAQLDKQHGSGQ